MKLASESFCIKVHDHRIIDDQTLPVADSVGPRVERKTNPTR
jgi:hypothetical protein